MVIDCGSCSIKAGFAGDHDTSLSPAVVFPAVVGRPKHARAMLGMPGMGKDGVCVGDEAQAKRGVLTLTHPTERGVVKSWEDMERVWSHALHTQLRACPSAQPVLLTEPPMNPTANRERVVQSMFEKFGVPAMQVVNSAKLSLYGSGAISGVVLECGEGVSFAVPVVDGVTQHHAAQRSSVAGADATSHLTRLLATRGLGFSTSAEREVARDLKERLAYVALDFDAELRATAGGDAASSYELPDGKVITVADERFRCAEVLFRPSLIGVEAPGLHELAAAAIAKCPDDARASLFGNVMLSGGSTCYRGMAARVEKEMTAVAAATGDAVSVVALPERKYAAWLGGSILASLESFRSDWVTKATYDECGPALVADMCCK